MYFIDLDREFVLDMLDLSKGVKRQNVSVSLPMLFPLFLTYGQILS